MPPNSSLGTGAEFKDVIRDLYIAKSWDLKRVQEYMKTQRGLDKPKSWYTTQLKNWGFRKNLKDVELQDCEIASYKVIKARKIGKKVNLYFRGQRITPRVLRGERFFLSKMDEVKLDNQKSPPQTPPGFNLVTYSREASPMSLNNENCLQSTIEAPKPPVIIRTQSPMRYIVQLDNLPWFEFQVLFHIFLKEQRISFRGWINDYLSSNHQTDFSDLYNSISIIDTFQVCLSVSEESTDVAYLLDVLGHQHGKDLQLIEQPRLGPIIDYLFTGGD